MRKPKHPLSRSEITGLVKRFVKPEAYIASRDIMLFYKVFEQFPDKKFWLAYDLGFQLNCIAWFLSEDGKARLTTDIALFNLDIVPTLAYHINETKVGEDVKTTKIKQTIFDLFKS